MYKILICDDDKDIVNAIKLYLGSSDYEFFEGFNGNDAVMIVESEDIQLIIMDIMMPQMDGIAAMAKIREKSNVPIIMLTAKSENADKVLGLNVGADDYITKPFQPLELEARVKSQLRRYLQLGGDVKRDNCISIGNIQIDDDKKSLIVDGNSVSLTPTEYEILKFLMENANKVFSPKEIFESIWNESGYMNDNTIAVHIRHIREKIEINPADPRFLKVVWGHGYMIEGEKR